MQVLRTEVEAREISDRVKTTEIRNPLPPSQQRSSRSTASALVARESGSHSVSCAYCKENHYSASCGKVTGISDHRDILRREGRCFVYLIKGHRARDQKMSQVWSKAPPIPLRTTDNVLHRRSRS